MYCSACGKALPNGAKYCSHCEQASGSDSADPTIAGEQEAAHTAQPCTSDSPRVAAESSASNSRLSVEAIALGVLAVTCIALGALQGFIPIFLIEGAAFGGLALLRVARRSTSVGLRSVVFVVSVLLAGLVGVTLDQETFGPHYRYLSQGSAQYRVDVKAGRTDRLGNGGWIPVAFDKEAEEIPISPTDGNNPLSKSYPNSTISLTQGAWTPPSAFGGTNGKICFLAANSSAYVLDRIVIDVALLDAALKVKSDATQPVTLKSLSGGLIAVGATGLVCGDAPQGMTATDGWTYSYEHAYGWQR
jgi:hypothetical protein